ncbi:hypothetical protein JNK13_06730 [bacterium]|nr:hypothetical protein [bacterium]
MGIRKRNNLHKICVKTCQSYLASSSLDQGAAAMRVFASCGQINKELLHKTG